MYEIGSPVPYGVDLPTTPVRLSSGRVVLEDGRPAPLGPLVLAPCFVRVEEKRIASDPVTKAAVYRVGSTARVSVSAPDGHAPGLPTASSRKAAWACSDETDRRE